MTGCSDIDSLSSAGNSAAESQSADTSHPEDSSSGTDNNTGDARPQLSLEEKIKG